MPTIQKRVDELLEGEVFRLCDHRGVPIDHKFYYCIAVTIKNTYTEFYRIRVRRWHGEAVGDEFLHGQYGATLVDVVHDTIRSIEC